MRRVGMMLGVVARLWIQCPCGARLERLVTPEDADDDLLLSALLASDN